MGKAGRVACIFTPWVMTLAALVLMVIIELGGWNSDSSLLNSVYTVELDLTNMTIPNTGDSKVAYALDQAKKKNLLKEVYQIHLWNYCSSDKKDKKINQCGDRQANYYFDPINTLNLNNTAPKMLRARDVLEEYHIIERQNAAQNAANQTAQQLKQLEEDILGKSGVAAMNAYRNTAKWMFIAFEVALWSTVATLAVGLLAIFSRWGSFFTWILAGVSSLFSFGASLTATILFAALTGALRGVLDKYRISITLGGKFLGLTWIATFLTIGATLFWLFSVCCCSGKSNPHHKSNEGGLWKAGPKHGGYGRGRGMRVEKTGGYERVASPYIGGHNEHGDRVPLADYPQPQGYSQGMHPGGAYEPFRQQH